MEYSKYRLLTGVGLAMSLFSPWILAADFADDFESGNLDTSRFQLQVGEGALHAGKVRLSVSTTEDEWRNARLGLAEHSDYVEGELTLVGGAILPTGRAQVGTRIEIRAYNTEADGGVDGQFGDVQVEFRLFADGQGRRVAQYCLQRSLDASFDQREAVMDGDDCRSLPVRIEFDRAYRAAVAVDRAASTITFRLDGHTQVVNISSGMFSAANPYAQLDVFASNAGAGQALVDNVRTAPNELTDSELAAGLTVPAAFPAAPDAASMMADSTIESPYDIYSVVSYVDDFSNLDSTALGYGTYAQAGVTPPNSITYVDDAVELAVHSPDGDYSHAAIMVNDYNSDFIKASISLSSKTALPVDSDARAEVSINATLVNDTYENAESRAGDLVFTLGLRQRGDGRLQVLYWANRRSESGSDDDLNIYELPGFDAFGDLQLALDTPYDVSIRLDRERRVMVISFGDVSAEYPLTSIYAAYRSELRLRTRHEAGSGRAVGRLHQLSTDELEFDFAQAVPAIAPLQPQWDARFADSSVDWADEHITLTVEGSKQGRGRARLASDHRNDFFGADLALSSDSTLAAGDTNSLSIGATLFNDTAPNTTAGSEQAGESFFSVEIKETDAEPAYAIYCYWRYDGENWLEQAGDTPEECDNRFSTVIDIDASYTASLNLDRDGKQVVWSLAGEEHNVALAAGIHDTASQYHRVQVTSGEQSIAIGHVDNLRFGRDAPALAESPDRLLIKVGDDPTDDGVSGDGAAGSSNSSGGGGSLHPLSLLIAAVLFSRRRKWADSSLGFSSIVGGCVGLALLSGCATEPTLMPALGELEPMDKPSYSEQTRVHKLDQMSGDYYSTEYKILPDGKIKGVGSKGCFWIDNDFIGPSESWGDCPHPKSEWRSGRNDDLQVTGQPWPLMIGNKFSYSYSSVDAKGRRSGASTRRCEVVEPVHLTLALGEIDAHQVRCKDSGQGEWWTKRAYFFSPEHGLVKYRKTHHKRGVDQDWEVVSIEAL